MLERLSSTLMLALCALISVAAQGAIFERTPTLRVETGMHVGGISALVTDPGNRYLVTGGGDKTVRVWSLPEGELLKTLRPPIGGRNEGRIDAVAISPDASAIAAGGETCRSYEPTHCVYIFDVASGRVTQRVTGFTGAISRLAWSADGRYLAVGFVGRGGVALVTTADWKIVATDAEYGSTVSGLDFDPRGARLAAASVDGGVRVYQIDGGALALKVRKETKDFNFSNPNNGQVVRNSGVPGALKFSPDGSRLAVGQLRGSSWVTLHNPGTLEVLHAAGDSGAMGRGIGDLAWSPDGSRIFAGTTSTDPGAMYIRSWGDGGRGGATNFPVRGGTRVVIAALRDGKVAFATNSPRFGVFDAKGAPQFVQEAKAAQFYGRPDTLKVSASGATVEFTYDSEHTLHFDLAARQLGQGPARGAAMAAPVTSAGNLQFYNLWRDTRGALQIGQTLLAMGPLEASRSLSIAPDQKSLAVGTNSYLRHYAADGSPLWSAPTTYPVFAVNMSGDGRFVVAAVADGTLRWYNRANGRLLLTLYVAPDRKRWVLASSAGFYDANVGAEDLMGWHVNRGRDEAADFFPVSRLRSRLYKPEVIARIIETADDAEAFKLAATVLGAEAQTVAVAPAPVVAVEPAPVVAVAPAPVGEVATPEPVQQVADITKVLPPVVTILSPASGSDVSGNQVTIRYTVTSAADAPVTAVRTRVNGLGQASRNLQIAAAGDTREITVTIPSEDTEVLLFAENRYGTSSATAVRLRWQGAKPAPVDQKPVLYVLAVGVSHYNKPEYRLNYAAKDAKDFVETVRRQQGRLYSDVVVKLLTDENASRNDVLAGFDWIQKQVTAKDVGMIFIAGHGLNDDRGNYYYMPVNADLDNLEATGVPFNQIKAHLASLPGKGLMFVDTCHSGNVFGRGGRRVSNDVNGVLNELSSAEYGLVVLASSTGRQYSLENSAWGNGAFTKALVEGLSGRADLKGRGRITHKMLDFYVSDRVEELTSGQQTPVNPSPQGVPDYVIAVSTT